jgi:hypothetical protein
MGIDGSGSSSVRIFAPVSGQLPAEVPPPHANSLAPCSASRTSMWLVALPACILSVDQRERMRAGMAWAVQCLADSHGQRGRGFAQH